ncbi:hypothetical protein SDC9_138504 [bioreactor metagenome]|uniref:Uncharacterized protein n=1 Tax=bioreactor metagenome TaxID=1076179 RepID=A0A645DQ10_9ZZZZ
MTQNAVETQTKNGKKSDKEYSIEWFEKTCIIKYKGKIKDRKVLKFVPFINSLGEAGVSIIAWLSVIVGYLSLMAVMIEYTGKISYIWLVILCIIPFSLFCYGLVLTPYVKYVGITGCKNCHKVYAYEETKNPEIKEVSTEDSYTISITRYWKCKYCGYMDITASPENITARKEKKLKKHIKIKCENCGKTELWLEYKKPDERSEENIFTRIRYYKCEYCGHINLKVEIKSACTESSTWESRGSDPRILN